MSTSILFYSALKLFLTLNPTGLNIIYAPFNFKYLPYYALTPFLEKNHFAGENSWVTVKDVECAART